MAIPYDKPIFELDNKLHRYARWLAREADRHNNRINPIFNIEDKKDCTEAYRDWENPYHRLALSNAGSVLRDICSLIFFQYDRSDNYIGKLKKRQELDAYDLLKKKWLYI
ncbi:MAG: hypothetical protein PHY54_20150 [Methylococcales bacterium]|nr:hypothetical protein [Methylococcales bacterium]